MTKITYLLGFLALFFLNPFYTLASSGDTITYRKPCSNYMRMAINSGDNQYKIIEKNGDKMLFECNLKVPAITYEMLSSDDFRRYTIRGSSFMKLYNKDGEIKFVISVLNVDSTLLKVYENQKLSSEYLFLNQRIHKIIEELDLDYTAEEVSGAILNHNPSSIIQYVNGAVFCTYSRLEDNHSSYYKQEFSKNDKIIQTNGCVLGYIVNKEEPDKKNYELFTSLSVMVRYKDLFSFPQIEYHPDYSVKTRQNLIGSNLTSVKFHRDGTMQDTSFSLFDYDTADYSNPYSNVYLLHRQVLDNHGKELFFYTTTYKKEKTTVTWRAEVRDSIIEIQKELSPSIWYDYIGQKFPDVYGGAPLKNEEEKYLTTVFYKKKQINSYASEIRSRGYGSDRMNLFNQENEYINSASRHEDTKHNNSPYILSESILQGEKPKPIYKKESIGKLSTAYQDRSRAIPYRDENLKIKKDFVSCLFGVWSESENNYVIPCEYMEIKNINSQCFQATKDFSEILIIDVKNNVVFSRESDFYFRQQHNFLLVGTTDSSFVLDPNFKIVYASNKNYGYSDLVGIGNYLILYEKVNDQSRGLSINEDSITIATVAGKLSQVQFKVESTILNLVYNQHEIFQLLPSGPKLLHKTADTLSTFNLNYHNNLISKKGSLITVYSADDENLTKHSFSMDNIEKWLFELEEYDSYSYRSSENSDLFIYEYAGKKGLLNKNLEPILLPIWDDISLKYLILKKEDNRYRFDIYGRVTLLPKKMIEMESDYSRYGRNKDKKSLIFYDDKTIAIAHGNDLYTFAKPIKQVGVFSKSFDNTNKDRTIISAITTDGDLYINRGNIFIQDKSSTGAFTDAANGKSKIILQGRQIGKEYDKVYQVGQMEYLNPLLKTGIQLKATDGSNTYKIDLSDASINFVNAIGGKETEINGHILGYDNNFKLYYNDCSKINYFPDTLKSFEVVESIRTDFVLAYTQSGVLQSRQYSPSYPYLFSLKTRQISSYSVRELKEIGPYILVQSPDKQKRVIDQNMSEIIPFSGMTQVVLKDNFYFINRHDTWYRYHLADRVLDTLKNDLRYTDPEKYVNLTGNEMGIYTFQNKLIAKSTRCFLDNLAQLKDLPVEYSENTQKTLSRYTLTPLQGAWVKSIFLASSKPQSESMRSIEYSPYPKWEYYEEQLAKTSSPKEDIFSEGYSDGYGYDSDEVFEMDEGGWGSSKYGEYQSEFAEVQNAFENKLNASRFAITDFKYLKNGLIMFNNSDNSYRSDQNYELYVELRDIGYQIWTFENIFDKSKLDSLHAFLIHKISLEPAFLGVTCNEDMQKYSLNYFAAKFKITDEYFSISSPNSSNYNPKQMELKVSDLDYFMTTEAKSFLKSLF